jgi:hypothetical protein
LGSDATACPNSYCRTAERWKDGVFSPAGNLLAARTCGVPKILGATCLTGSECQSGFCVEGVCCNQPCDGPCQSCLSAHKADGSSSGSCGYVHPNTDPKGQCASDPINPCGATGLCGWYGQCQMVAEASTSCGANACSSDGMSALNQACNGQGACVASSVPCGGYRCENGACFTSCKDSKDCAANYVCLNGGCTKDTGSGGQGGMAGNGAAGVAGSGTSGASVSDAQEVSSDGGCGCSLPGPSTPAKPITCLLAVGLLCLRRRFR